MAKDYKFIKLEFNETNPDRRWFCRGFLEDYTIVKENDMYSVYTSKYLSGKPKKTLKAAIAACQKINNERLQTVVDSWIIFKE